MTTVCVCVFLIKLIYISLIGTFGNSEAKVLAFHHVKVDILEYYIRHILWDLQREL